jgi:hypothetical protein
LKEFKRSRNCDERKTGILTIFDVGKTSVSSTKTFFDLTDNVSIEISKQLKKYLENK